MNKPEISRRETLKTVGSATAAYTLGLHLPALRSDAVAVPGALSGTELSFLNDMLLQASLDPAGLEGLYDAWMESGSSGSVFRRTFEKLEYVKPGEPITHATWKRVIHTAKKTDVVIDEIMKEFNARVENDRMQLLLSIQDLMHQPFELYDDAI